MAQAVLSEKLVACANILPPMRSLYLWEGRLEESAECGVLFKTTALLLDSAVSRIAALHPYETPVVIGWLADAAAPATLQWLQDSLGSDRNQPN